MKKGNWSNSGNIKIDDISKSSKRGGGFGTNHGMEKDFDKRRVQCNNYENFVHCANEWWHRKDGKKGNENDEELNIAHNDFEVVFLMDTTCEGDPICEDWYLDSRCSNHMINHKEWLTNFDSSKRTNARLANSRNLAPEGICDIVINRRDYKNALTKNALYVPGMKCNLISTGQVAKKGF